MENTNLNLFEKANKEAEVDYGRKTKREKRKSKSSNVAIIGADGYCSELKLLRKNTLTQYLSQSKKKDGDMKTGT